MPPGPQESNKGRGGGRGRGARAGEGRGAEEEGTEKRMKTITSENRMSVKIQRELENLIGNTRRAT